MPSTALIQYAIPQQNFELIRDQIAAILLAEFTSQQVTFNLPATMVPTTVDIERFVPVDEETFPIINVRLATGKYLDEEGNQTKDSSGDAEGTYRYYVDVYTGSATLTTGGPGGDQLATTNLHRMMGIIRAILDHPIYNTLGFQPDGPLKIWNTHISNFFINLPENTGDAVDYICGRIVFSVKACETSTLVLPKPLQFIGVTLKLKNNSEYFYWVVQQMILTVSEDGDTFTNAFFSNPIVELDLLNTDGSVASTYKVLTDFTIDTTATTITAIDFTFSTGQKYLAKTSTT